MRTFLLIVAVSLSSAANVKREADPEATAEADASADPAYAHHHGHAGYAEPPVCTLTPVKECVPRQVEHPRKVCQTVIDLHEDTVVTENCEEVITTTCTQVSQEAHHTSAVVDRSHRLVEEGVPVPYAAHPVKAHGHAGYGKREAEADAEAEPEANAEASADPYYSHGHGYRRGYHGYGRLAHAKVHAAPVHPPVPVHAAHSPKKVAPPVCESVPVKTCNKVPVSTPRKVPRTVCDTVVDITTIEDCHETVTKHCTQTSTTHHSHSAVVGHESKVVAVGEEVAHGHVAGYAHHG